MQSRVAFGIILVFSIVVTFIIVSKQCDKHKTMKKKTTGENYLKSGSFRLTENVDKFLRVNKTRVRVDSGSGGGSSGSSTHSGSSGTSHGGGGRSF